MTSVLIWHQQQNEKDLKKMDKRILFWFILHPNYKLSTLIPVYSKKRRRGLHAFQFSFTNFYTIGSLKHDE